MTFDAVRTVDAERLGVTQYLEDFEAESVEGVDGWKLEVRQTFQEPGNESWLASIEGDWTRSLRLLEEGRGRVQLLTQSPPHPFHRVRITEQPLSAYMQWELRSLAIRDELGELIRIIDVTYSLERQVQLDWPEIVVLGDAVLYEVMYTDDGVLDGARKITDKSLVSLVRNGIRELHVAGQPIRDYVRQVMQPA